MPKSNRQKVYDALDTERVYQGDKWGDKNKPVECFILYMEDYLAEARKLVSRTSGDDPEACKAVLDTIRKVTALGVACMEQHGAPERYLYED